MLNLHKAIGRSIRKAAQPEVSVREIELDDWQREVKRKHPELMFKPGRALPLGKSYVGHCGKAQRLRNLKHQLHRVEKIAKHDAAAATALTMLREFVKDDPDPDYAFLHLVSAALDAADGTGASWAQAASSLMLKFSMKAAENELADPHDGAQV